MHHIGMIDSGRCPRFLLKTVEESRIGGHVRSQDLDRDHALESRIAGPVGSRKRTLSDKRFDEVPISDESAFVKCAVSVQRPSDS